MANRVRPEFLAGFFQKGEGPGFQQKRAKNEKCNFCYKLSDRFNRRLIESFRTYRAEQKKNISRFATLCGLRHATAVIPCSTPPGGNQVDGLPPDQSFELMAVFPELAPQISVTFCIFFLNIYHSRYLY